MQIRLQVNPSAAGGRNTEAAYDAGHDADGIDEATAGLENTPVETTPPAPDPERPNRRELADDSQELTQIEEGGEAVVISPELTRRNQAAFNAFENLREAAKQLIDCNTPGYYNDESRAAVLQGVVNNLQNAEARLREATQRPGGMGRGDAVTLPESEYHVAANGRRVRRDVLGRETEQPVTVGMLYTTLSALQRQVNRFLHPQHSTLRVTSHVLWVQREGIRIRVEPDGAPQPVAPTAVHSPTRATTLPRQRDEARYVADLETAMSNFYTYLRAAEQGGARASEWINRARGQSRAAHIALGRLVEEHPDGSQPVQLSDGARVNIRELHGRVEALDTALDLARTHQRRSVAQVTAGSVAAVSVQAQPPRIAQEQSTELAWNHVQMGHHNLDRATELRAGDVRRSALLQRANSDLEAAREALQRAREAGEPSTRCDQIQMSIDALAREISEALAPIF